MFDPNVGKRTRIAWAVAMHEIPDDKWVRLDLVAANMGRRANMKLASCHRMLLEGRQHGHFFIVRQGEQLLITKRADHTDEAPRSSGQDERGEQNRRTHDSTAPGDVQSQGGDES